MGRTKALFLCFILLLTSHEPTWGRVINGALAHDAILRSITDFLDRQGRDVRNGKPTGEADLARPQLTDLSNFPMDARIAGSSGAFDPAFTAGVNSERAYLVAINHPGTLQPSSLKEFKSAWDSAVQGNRVFISFSGKDFWAAEIVAQALRDSGYAVFLYKNNSTDLPPVNAVETGQFFREAGHHYVIDTSNARSSAAVNAEALALNPRGRQAYTPIVPPGRTKVNNSRTVPCCHICHYLNGALVGCDPPICDEIVCAHARPESP